MYSKIISILIIFTMLMSRATVAYSMATPMSEVTNVLSSRTYSLADRYNNSYVNNVFADNILLTLAYMRGTVKEGQTVNWNMVKSDFTYTMVLKSGTSFAFHDSVLPQYKNNVSQTTNAHFDASEGFESDGWLVGDGVCHLASFINVVARTADLFVVSPTPHNFARIPDVPEKYGVAIYYMPGETGSSSMQNLYITNTFNKPVAFIFTHNGTNLTIRVEKLG
ncbi:MAG TPA: hypothetical protein VGT05_02725 [Patescibacteria group bacterium]|nr:hypothetical protein [Patescibacteria group bacterium]